MVAFVATYVTRICFDRATLTKLTVQICILYPTFSTVSDGIDVDIGRSLGKISVSAKLRHSSLRST